MKKIRNYKIRPVNKSDKQAMALVYQACYSTLPLSEKWPHHAALKRVSQLLQQNHTQGWALTVFNQVVGFAFLQSREGFNGAYGELLEAAVHPYFRRQGLGRAVLKRVRDYQKKKKLKVVYTLAYKGMFEGFYKKSGFKPAKRSLVYVWK